MGRATRLRSKVLWNENKTLEIEFCILQRVIRAGLLLTTWKSNQLNGKNLIKATRVDKFEIAKRALDSIASDSGNKVLDVGCRDCIFSTLLADRWSYEGLDLFQNQKGSVTYVQSVEDGIPVPDRTFAATVALDVVEHVDRMSAVMDELWRVTDRKLIVALPNMAYALYRFKFLLSGSLGEKYRLLPYGQDSGDRHRWLTTADECVRYMREFANAQGRQAKLSWQATAESATRKVFSKVFGGAGFSEQFHAPTIVFVLERV